MKTSLNRIRSVLYGWIKKYKLYIAWWVIISVLSWSILIGVSAADQWFVASYYLNVRTEGRYGAPIMTSVKRGDKITILESMKNGWKKVELSGGIVGYVNGRYLSLKDPITRVSYSGIYKVAVGNAFVRGDTLQTKVAVVNRDDHLESLDNELFQGKWLRVKIVSSTSKKYDNQVGYISKDLVVSTESVVTATDSATPVNTGTWIEDFNVVNLLSPTGSGSGVGTLAPLTSSTSNITPIQGAINFTGSGTNTSEVDVFIDSILK